MTTADGAAPLADDTTEPAPEELALGRYELYDPGKLFAHDSTYINFGYWAEATTFTGASEALTDALARTAGLAPGDRVLDVGFGFGAQDFRWLATYPHSTIDAVTITASHLAHARSRAEREGLTERITFHRCSATAIEQAFIAGSFDRVLALEAAFHFDTRAEFFRQAHTLLRPGGVLAVTDIVPRHPQATGTDDPLRASMFAGMAPEANWYGVDTYRDRLATAGFDDVEIRSIHGDVFAPYLRAALRTVDDPEYVERVGTELADLVRENLSDQAALHAQIDGLDYVLVRAVKS
ncbi:SAM-dependent methyltransferase [Streptomyces tendae]|uniref:SAM-dependent methyltransferase n=1 Tax=Streptomyces tendae TaxID=1932 RepID=UPI00381C68A5